MTEALSRSFAVPAPSDEIWSVGALVTAVKRLVEGELMPLWVRGEILQCKVWSSGHWYFTLRDAESQIRCCMWKMQAARAGTPPADGTEVFVLGKAGLYEQKGELQFIVSRIVPTAAVRRQQQELERVKAALQRDGLFDAARKRRLPAFASTVGVVTSPNGAALRDIITVAQRRWPCARILVFGARVQGDGAAEELVRALRLVNGVPDLDVCIVGRGGGGREDLAAFNNEAVCRALADVRVPTISAVGHEIDVSLTDLVADLRAPTPSAAAEHAVPDWREVMRQIDDLSNRLASSVGNRTRLVAERLARTDDRLRAGIGGMLDRHRMALQHLGAQLDALSPLRVLDRGYAVALDATGRTLRRRADFTPGAPFRLRVTDGNIGARVESVE